MRPVLIAVAALTAACAMSVGASRAEAGEAIDAFDLHIAIGRWGVMLSEIHDLTVDPEGAPVTDDDVAAPRTLARALRETVWEYNLQRSRMCALNDLPQASCGAAFEPAWLSEPADAAPSLAELDRRSNAVGHIIMPFWDSVCERTRAKVPADERMAVCPME